MSRQRLSALLDDLIEDTGWEAADAASGDALVVGADGDAVATVYGAAAHLASPEARAAFIAEARHDVPLLLTVLDKAVRYLQLTAPHNAGHPRHEIDDARAELHRATVAMELRS